MNNLFIFIYLSHIETKRKKKRDIFMVVENF